MRISMKQLADTEYLRHLYQSGCAFYMYGSCPAIDIAASVRVNGTYYPLVVSVNTRRTVTKGEATTACNAMKVAFDLAEIKYGFCILLLIGLDDPKTDYGVNLLQGSDLTSANNCIISKVIAVPTEDEFGISSFVTNTTVGGNGISEVYASHCFLTNFMKSNYEHEEKSTLLRKSADKEVSGYLSKFATCCLLSSTDGSNAASQEEMAMGEAVPPEKPMATR